MATWLPARTTKSTRPKKAPSGVGAILLMVCRTMPPSDAATVH